RRGEWGEARRLLEEAVRHQTAALERNGRHPTYRASLRGHYRELADALARLGKKKEAAEAVREMRAAFARLADKSPGDPAWRRAALASARHNLGIVLGDRAKLAEAEKALLAGLEIRKVLVSKYGYYRQDLGASYNGLGLLYLQRGEPAKAEAAHREAVAVLRK